MQRCLLAVLLCLAVPTTAGAQSIARGKYIVERVGMCDDCHTPRDATGRLIAERKLKGAPIAFRPMQEMPWADQAPALARLPAYYSPKQLAEFLRTGKRPDGSTPRPPMPPYRLSKEDAWSVVDYLRTLK